MLDHIYNLSEASRGEMILFQLARAYLNYSKVILYEEHVMPTEKDTVIFELLNTVFKKSTVLIFTDRIERAFDWNKLLLITDGVIVDFMHPFKFLVE